MALSLDIHNEDLTQHAGLFFSHLTGKSISLIHAHLADSATAATTTNDLRSNEGPHSYTYLNLKRAQVY
ncbi:hypothetical protein MtrunA17_Chr1g0199791 [Medicago truncatula]|uniref:Uncharacterized protein n=1 Tax=Medicago truncatula TaxID=3880 RepID=A0A072VND3_MEDTR|nr:hypothetical protein MTR_1g095145 [Medicago truncatula]RHN81500.1 hypothetical protein MtrunA17_Chr1g0199791 [Medicago truncatula]